MSEHADVNRDADAGSEGAGGPEAVADVGDSDNENGGRAQPKQSKEKADPTLVPKSGAHWQHDSRGVPGAASSGRGGGRGRRLFETEERGGKTSGGRSEEKWQHDKFSEVASSSGTALFLPAPPPHPFPSSNFSPLLADARPASGKGKGRQHPPAPAPAAVDADIVAASDRAPRHVKGAPVAALAAAASALSIAASSSDAVSPEDAGWKSRRAVVPSPRRVALPPNCKLLPRGLTFWSQPRVRALVEPAEGGIRVAWRPAARALAAADGVPTLRRPAAALRTRCQVLLITRPFGSVPLASFDCFCS
jgi:hypothetical protein